MAVEAKSFNARAERARVLQALALSLKYRKELDEAIWSSTDHDDLVAKLAQPPFSFSEEFLIAAVLATPVGLRTRDYQSKIQQELDDLRESMIETPGGSPGR